MSSSEYDIYPKDLQDPYKARRSKVALDLYTQIGIPMSDTPAKLRQLSRNFCAFDAPCLLLFTLKKYMGPPQWADVGMLIQNLTLLALERGLATCPQEAWANHSTAIKEYLKIPDDHILFCGVSVGYEDVSAPINHFQTERAELEDFATFHAPKAKL
jgi:nitroreductase